MHIRHLLLASLAAIVCFVGAVTHTSQAEPDQELKEQIRKTADKGVAFLRRNQLKDGSWSHMGAAGNDPIAREFNVGATALCGIAMLESGVDVDDSAVQRALSLVRGQARNLTWTYPIACSIIFLDRASKGGDGGTITMLAQKLLAGQTRNGAWGYASPIKMAGDEDHSNTQFAILALWIARRHGTNADNALKATEKRFRGCQNDANGSWPYRVASFGQITPGTPSMTGAGLLALAFGHGVKFKRETMLKQGNPNDASGEANSRPQRTGPDLKADPQVIKAKEFLTSVMARGTAGPADHEVYFLWTLERVCMIYRYTQFNGIDWYNYGSKFLIARQEQDGSWRKDTVSGPNCETAWALLFLNKSNLASDLDIGEATFTGASMKDVGRRGGPAAKPVEKEKVNPGREGKPGEAIALKEELSNTVVSQRIDEILELLEMTKGSDYTQALVEVIPNLRPAVQDRVRQTLARRVERMSVKTLMAYLGTDTKELRLAALTALKAKGERDQIPDLIPLLGERDGAISNAAYEALKKLSGKDLGRTQAAWLKWWDEGGK